MYKTIAQSHWTTDTVTWQTRDIYTYIHTYIHRDITVICSLCTKYRKTQPGLVKLHSPKASLGLYEGERDLLQGSQIQEGRGPHEIQPGGRSALTCTPEPWPAPQGEGTLQSSSELPLRRWSRSTQSTPPEWLTCVSRPTTSSQAVGQWGWCNGETRRCRWCRLSLSLSLSLSRFD